MVDDCHYFGNIIDKSVTEVYYPNGSYSLGSTDMLNPLISEPWQICLECLVNTVLALGGNNNGNKQ